MKRYYNDCWKVSGKDGNKIRYPHPTDRLCTIERNMSTKKVVLTEEVKEHDAAFGGLGETGGYLNPAIQLGFVPDKKGRRGMTRFMSVNKEGVSQGVKLNPGKACDPNKKVFDEFTYSIDFKVLRLAAGKLQRVHVVVTLDAENRTVTFTQEGLQDSGFRLVIDDMAYGVIYDTVEHGCMVTELKRRGESGSVSVTVPEWCDFSALAIYTFTLTRDKRKSSNSECLHYEAPVKV